MADGSLNLHPSVLNGASFVGAFTWVVEGETLDEPGDDYDLGDDDDSGSGDDDRGKGVLVRMLKTRMHGIVVTSPFGRKLISRAE